MRTKDILGYLCLFTGLYTFFELHYQLVGLFLQGMALGFFGKSAVEQIKERKQQKKSKKKEYIKAIVNTDFKDTTKMYLLELKSMGELRRLEHTYKEKNE